MSSPWRRSFIFGIVFSSAVQVSQYALVPPASSAFESETFAGVAILMEQREILLSFDFNECILLYSDAPDVVGI